MKLIRIAMLLFTMLVVAFIVHACNYETYNECASRMVWKENAKNWDEVNAECD